MEARIRGKSWVEGEGETGSLGLPGIAVLQRGCTLPYPGLHVPPSSLQCLWGPLQQVPGRGPSPIKVRTSPVSHPAAISPCILGGSFLQTCLWGYLVGTSLGTEAGPGLLEMVETCPPPLAGVCPDLHLAPQGGKEFKTCFHACAFHPAREWGTCKESLSFLCIFFFFRAALISDV